MKKILFLIMLMFLNPISILASEIIYSDYSEFGPYTEEYIESSELVDVVEEQRYLWYKEEKVLGNYELYLGNNNVSDCYDTEYSSWSKTYEEKLGRTYEERTVYNYELSNELRYIHLTDLYGSNGAFRIPELIVKVDGVEIKYDYTCEGCMSGFGEYINNGIYNENKSYIHNGGSLIIDLKQTYPIHKVELIFYIFDLGEESKKYTVSYSSDLKNIYASNSFIYEFSDEYWLNSKLVNHDVYNLGISKDLWLTNETYYEPLESQYIVNEYIYSEYRYKETYCKTYTLNKIYNNTYTKDGVDGFNLKDETKVKTYYSYRTREKLELEDNFVINSYDYDLNDFVIYSSEEYEINIDIDINKNGIYNITFKTNNLNIEKLVEVNILDNAIKTYKEEIESLELIINNLNKEKNELIEFYELQIEDKIKIIDDLKNEIKNCKESCEENRKCLQQEIENKNKLLDEYKSEIDNLKNKINDLNNMLNKLEISNKEGIEMISNLNSLISNLQNDLSVKEKYINDLINENKVLKEEIDYLKFENNNYLNQINYLEQLNFGYNNKIQELEYIIHKLDNEIEILSNENYINKDEIKNLTELVDMYENEISILQNEIINVKKYIDELKEKSLYEVNDLNAKLENITKLNKEYFNNIEKLESNIEELNQKINLLKEDSENNYNEYNQKINSLEILNREYLNKIKELENQLHNTNKSISDTISYKNEIMEKYKNEIELLKESTKETEAEYENLNNKLQQTTNENIDLNEKLNNYVLKINGDKKIDSFWIYILILIVILIYFLRKKSIKK